MLKNIQRQYLRERAFLFVLVRLLCINTWRVFLVRLHPVCIWSATNVDRQNRHYHLKYTECM